MSLLTISLPRNPVPPVMNTVLFLKKSWMFDCNSEVLQDIFEMKTKQFKSLIIRTIFSKVLKFDEYVRNRKSF